jgi:hypothetical protein
LKPAKPIKPPVIQKALLLICLTVFTKFSFALVIYEDTKMWNQPSITLYFKDGTAQQQSEVKNFAKIWERYTGIKFEYSTTKPSLFNFNKYYTITFKGNKNESHQGALNGTMHLGQLSDDIVFRKKTILHEFGHMLGLAHEHQRQDRAAVLNDPKVVDSCAKSQKQARSWCRENLFELNKDPVFVQSDYDSHSIMHYEYNNFIDNHLKTKYQLFDEPSNSLSLTDKVYIAMLYNPDLSSTTLDNMHKQDVWEQEKFERQAKQDKDFAMQNLQTASCKTLKYGTLSKDGRMCDDGFMIIGQDDLTFHEDEFSICFLSLKELDKTMKTHEFCQLSYSQLLYRREAWNKGFENYGNCKRLDTNQKNNQDFYCAEGFSYVTQDNDMVEEKTKCYGSQEQVFKEMMTNEVCNLTSTEFFTYTQNKKKDLAKQLTTETCSVVKKQYKTINCPDNYDFTIIKNDHPLRPINRKCFANEFQALREMKKIGYCSN